MRRILAALVFFCLACSQASVAQRESDREHDGFVGPVKKVFEWWSPISGGNYPPGSRCRTMTKVYDPTGRLVQHSLYPGACGVDEIRNDYSYAPDGSRTEQSQEIRGKDSPPPPPPLAGARPQPEAERGQRRVVFKYDPATGKLVESASIWPGGKVGYKITYSYDDQGRLTETTSLDENGQVSSRRVLGYTGDQRVPSSFTYYGGRGDVYERTVYSDYEFNPQGDWFKRKVTTEERYNRRSISVSTREIEYYPSGQ